MVLRDPRQIDAQKQSATSRNTVITLATSATIDNENLTIGITRKVRRAVIVSRENARMTFHFATQDAAGANDANLNKRVELTPYGNQVLEPEKGEESVLSILGSTTVRRLSGYVETVNGVDGDALPAGLGVDIELEYYDDVGG